MNKLVSLAAFAFLATSAIAGEIDCSDLGALDEARITACMAKDREATEKELNVRYRALLERSPAIAEEIKASQSAWINYRDAQCDLEATDMEGGSGQREYYYRCIAKKNRARIDELDPNSWIVANP